MKNKLKNLTAIRKFKQKSKFPLFSLLYNNKIKFYDYFKY